MGDKKAGDDVFDQIGVKYGDVLGKDPVIRSGSTGRPHVKIAVKGDAALYVNVGLGAIPHKDRTVGAVVARFRQVGGAPDAFGHVLQARHEENGSLMLSKISVPLCELTCHPKYAWDQAGVGPRLVGWLTQVIKNTDATGFGVALLAEVVEAALSGVPDKLQTTAVKSSVLLKIASLLASAGVPAIDAAGVLKTIEALEMKSHETPEAVLFNLEQSVPDADEHKATQAKATA